MPGAKPSYLQTFIAQIVSQTFIPVKPLYAGFGHYTLNMMVCQAHLLQNHAIKKPTNGEKFVDFVIFISKSFKSFKNQDKRFGMFIL